MKLSDFDFDLPEGRIATRPARPRSAARLLVAEGGGIADRIVRDLPAILRPGDRLILNNTRVIPARLTGTRARATGQGEAVAKIEVTLTDPLPDGRWDALVKPQRKLAVGEVVRFEAGLEAKVDALSSDEGSPGATLAFNLTGAEFDAALQRAGAMPLPPYIARIRPPDDADRADYQTVFARTPGAVAAPTASLHFDAPLIAGLVEAGITLTEVTLHVGAGTFLPVKVEDVSTHRMHAEWGEVTEAAAADIAATRAAGGRIIPVGTTALRLIETSAMATGEVTPWRGPTDIFIYPGFRFRAADGLMTNFHLPKSTLMMLVSALMGRDRIMEIYSYAIRENYRFFSYGDASLLIP